MSGKNRRPWKTATSITQPLLDYCQDNLLNGMEAIIEITAPDGSIIRASDRNKYVGEHFYEALTNFPNVKRTVGDWLGNGLVFSEIDLEISNVDGRFNKFLPSGESFGTWINRRVVLKIGIGDKSESYSTIFSGQITKEGGFSRSTKSITIKARNDFERLNEQFPKEIFTDTTHPDAEESLWGKVLPIVYGDWTKDVTAFSASLPALCVNGANIFVNSEQLAVDIISDDGAALFIAKLHRLNDGDHVRLTTTNDNKTMQGDYYVRFSTDDSFRLAHTPSGTVIPVGGLAQDYSVSKPNHVAYRNVSFVVSENDLDFFGDLYLLRQDYYYKIPRELITLSSGKNNFTLKQNDTDFKINSEKWTYNKSDKFFVLAKGKNLGGTGFDGNLVSIAKDILKTYGGILESYFDSKWETYRASSTDRLGRSYISEPYNVIEYCIQLLEQIMLEPFVTRSLNLSLNSLRFSDWTFSPEKKMTNWDIEKDSFQIKIDDRNNFNRARAVYNYLPDMDENNFSTEYFKNQAAIDQQGSIETKALTFPNLQKREDAEHFLKETLKIASGFREVVTCTVTPRLFLTEIGQMLSMYVDIASIHLDGVPAMIREISYNTSELKIELTLWAFTMIPFGDWTPNFYGTVGGQSAIITND